MTIIKATLLGFFGVLASCSASGPWLFPQPPAAPTDQPPSSRLPDPPAGESPPERPMPPMVRTRTELLFDVEGRNSAHLRTTLAWDRRVITIAEHFYDGKMPSPVDLYARAQGDIRRIEAIARIEMPGRVRTAFRTMREHIPDPGTYDGLIVHDIESWAPYFRPDVPATWDAHENEFLTLLRTRFPERLRDPGTGRELTGDALHAVLEAEYTSAAKAWAGELLRETRRQAPHARQGWYMIPHNGYWDANNTTIKASQRQINDEQLSWFWPLVDVLCPNAYERYEIIPDGQSRTDTKVWAGDDLKYKRLRAAEVARLSQRLGKPDLWFVGLFVYHPRLSEETTPSDVAIANTAAVFRDTPPAGLILWGYTAQGHADTIRRHNEQIERWEAAIGAFRR
jgi:hypothetical protein